MKTVLAATAASVVLAVLVGGQADAGPATKQTPQASLLSLAGLQPMTGHFDLRSTSSSPQPLTEAGFASIPPESPVADAAMRSDVETVRILVKQGADVNAAQGDGMTALHWAAQNGDAALVEVLLYAGASPRAATRNGAYTPLHLAGKAGDAEVVKALLVGGANPNTATTTGGAAPLHFAAASGSADAVRVLLEHGAEVDVRESAWEQTPMMWAAAYGHAEVVKALLEKGGDVSAISKVEDIGEREKAAQKDEQRRERRMTALAAVAQPAESGQAATEENQASRSRGAPAERPSGGASEDAEEANLSQEGANLEVPLSYGDLVGNKGGLTSLLFAVRQGNTETALALLDGGADINQVSGDNTSPMLMATINGHFDLALQLLERGADVNIASDGGATPLYAAINVQWAPKALYPQPVAHKQQQAGYLEFMEQLLEAGADPNVRLTKHLWYMEYNFSLLQVDTKGATPFWRAAYATDVPAMKLLVEHGADPSIPTEKSPERRRRGGAEDDKADPSGLAPIPVGGPAVYPIHAASGVGFGEGYAANSHRSAPGGWIPAVKYLIEELGADANARDHNGYNALHHAAARGDNELIKYLVEQGVDVTAVSRRGQTTADMANGPVQRVPPFLATVELLESLGSKNNNKCMSC